MAKKVTDEDLELLDELGVVTEPVPTGGRTAREQRIIAGFEEIQRFVQEHGHTPQHGDGRDIFERIYAVRLDRIRNSPECREALQGLDPNGLLTADQTGPAPTSQEVELTDEELLASLGVEESPADVTQLVHVRSREEIRVAEEIARRNPCLDFGQFKPIFEQVQEDLKKGVRTTMKYGDHAAIKKENLFILDGQKALVAEMGEEFDTEFGKRDRRLRVVYDNGTESNLLLRSLQRALYKDKASRRITEPGFGPLFSDVEEEGDQESGTIYVLQSQSEHPFLLEHKNLIHKIGVTGGSVKSRVANAKKDPTYLLADVDIVAEYKLSNINRSKLENLLHKFFGNARMDMQLKDRFGSHVQPQEWFLVPLTVIDDAIEKIMDGTIGDFRFDTQTATLVRD